MHNELKNIGLKIPQFPPGGGREAMLPLTPPPHSEKSAACDGVLEGGRSYVKKKSTSSYPWGK